MDWWGFAGTAGELLTVSAENPGSPRYSALRYDVYGPGGYLTAFYSYGGGYYSYDGQGDSPTVKLPASGTYFVAVRPYYDYQGEYRLRVSAATPPLQMESENNDDLSQADPLALAPAPGSRAVGGVAGYVASNDSSGDYYTLGYVHAPSTSLNHFR